MGIVNGLEILHAFPMKESPIVGLRVFAAWLNSYNIDEALRELQRSLKNKQGKAAGEGEANSLELAESEEALVKINFSVYYALTIDA